MEWGERDVESEDLKEQARMVEKDFPRIKLYEQQGMTDEEACAKVWPEWTPEERAVWERVFERSRNEVERIKKEWG